MIATGFSEAMLLTLRDACAICNRHGLAHEPTLSPGGTHLAIGRADGSIEVVQAASRARVRLLFPSDAGASTSSGQVASGGLLSWPRPVSAHTSPATTPRRRRDSFAAAKVTAFPPALGWPAGTAHPATCEIVGEGARRGVALQPGLFRLYTCDADGRPLGGGGEQVRVKARGPAPMRVGVIDAGDGSYEIAYLASQSGSYQIAISIGAHPVATVQLTLETARSGVPRCSVLGAGTVAATAGQPASFRVVAEVAPTHQERCASMPSISAELRPAASLAATEEGQGPGLAAGAARGHVQESSPGVFDVTYTPLIAGAHTLHVTVQPAGLSRALHLPGSPFQVAVIPARAHPGACEARWAGGTRAEDGALEVRAGDELRCEIVTRDLSG
eukprot:CAMPEP_0179841700 /NCGR_PEP_ID=MMETSP0982-20121206/2698_1 /TAXON_ID=483367 /ORGANISM="non described non described, Strain CCMP 2436" /LENGTH=386 /DNA_ID=CAMNT_0021725853 /DNA_START=242 /DNA_END=1399 /DNA_ORIENTATION=-